MAMLNEKPQPEDASERSDALVDSEVLSETWIWEGLGLVAVSTAALLTHPDVAIATTASPVVQRVLDSSVFQATSLIFVSELGDKTFFIASILAAKTSRLVAFTGSFGALAVMTLLSVLIGQVFHVVPNITNGVPIDDYIAIASFLYFGIKSIYDGLSADGTDSGIAEEREEAEETVKEMGLEEQASEGRPWGLVGEAFTLTLAAELGDRSQITTVALSAAGSAFGVTVGALIGHAFATGGAVLGGSLISKYFSERVIGIVGGALFIVFAITTAVPLVI